MLSEWTLFTAPRRHSQEASLFNPWGESAVSSYGDRTPRTRQNLQREKCSCSRQPSLECRVEEKVLGAYDLGRGEEGTDELSWGGGDR